MEESYYRIVITGVRSGNSSKKVIGNLSRLFKTDPSKFQSLAKGGRVTVSKKSDQKKASVYKSTLERIGCTILVEPLLKQSNIYSEKQHTSKLIQNFKCPNCKYIRKATDMQSASECPKCGIVYEKFISSRSIGNQQIKKNKTSVTQNVKKDISQNKTNKKVYLYIITGVFTFGAGLRSCGRSANIGGMENVHGMGEGVLAVLMLIFGLGLIAIGVQKWLNPKAVEKAQKAENDLIEKRSKNLPRYFISSVIFLVTYSLGAFLKLLDIELGAPCLVIGYIGTILYGYKILPFVLEKGAMRTACYILLFILYLNWLILFCLTILLKSRINNQEQTTIKRNG